MKYIIAMVIVATLTYLMISFINLEFDYSLWSYKDRIFVVVMIVLWSLFGSAMLHLHYESK